MSGNIIYKNLGSEVKEDSFYVYVIDGIYYVFVAILIKIDFVDDEFLIFIGN